MCFVKMADSLMDFSGRCRLCIEPKRLSLDIFSEEGRRMKLRSKINKHLSVKILQSDGLPNQICYQCLFRLETWVSFKQLCMERDQVMKTWSRSYSDEVSCEVEGTFNGRHNNCKSGKTQEGGASQSSKSHPFPRDIEVGNEAFPGNQMEDAKSDTSIWEVVKMDDPESVPVSNHGKGILQNLLGDSSSTGYCTLTDNANDKKHDWNNRRKSRKPSKVASSGSDTSNSVDVRASCTELLGDPVDLVTLSTVPSSICYNQSSNSEEMFIADGSRPPLKRKRGRPSKALLQRERELKKVKGQEKTNSNSPTYELMNQSSDLEKEIVVDEKVTLDPEPTHVICSHVVTPEFTPVENDDGSGVTKVVLDDPDFGSMKFTLSVIDVESPTSSPIPTDGFKYYNYASSSGNISSDSVLREDFEGFESPSSFVKPTLKDDGSSADEMPRSKSQDDVWSTGPNDMVPPTGIKCQHENFELGDLRESCSFSDLSIGDPEEAGKNDIKSKFYQCGPKQNHGSKSLECLSVLNETNRSFDGLEERNAYSDGELSESTRKHFRR